MQKINIIGTTGSGKSTLAKGLSAATGIPCFHIDALFWKPNWQESSDTELFEKIEAVVKQDRWILDGNYSRTSPIKWRNVDTIIWLDYSFARNFKQLLIRSLQRAFSKQELWENTGNVETFSKLFSRDSIMLWFFRNYQSNRSNYLQLMDDERYAHIQFVHLRNPKQTREFLDKTATLSGR